jgi:hypothetical protein
MAIPWTTAHRQQLHGWRTQHEDDDRADSAPSLAEAWTYLRALPIPKVEGTASKQLAAVAASLAKPAPPSKLDLQQEILRATLLFNPPGETWKTWDGWRTARMLVALWHQAGSVRFVLELLTATRMYEVGLTWGPTLTVEVNHVTDPADASALSNSDILPLWWALRCRVAVMTEAELSEAVAVGRRAVPAKPPKLVADESNDAWMNWVRIVFVLSRAPDFTGPEIDRMLAAVGESEVPGATMLAAAAPDLARVRAVVARAQANFAFIPDSYMFDLVEAFGGEVAELLEQVYLERRKVSAATYLRDAEAAMKFAKALASGRPMPGQKKPSKPATNKPATKKPATKKPATKPAAKKRATKKPATKKPATKPAAKKRATKKKLPVR